MLLHELMLRRNAARLLHEGAAGFTSASSVDEAMENLLKIVRDAVASAMQLTAAMAMSIDGDQPLLDAGMNSMQLTLFVSIIRSSVPFAFSIGKLLLLPVISINSIAAVLHACSAAGLPKEALPAAMHCRACRQPPAAAASRRAAAAGAAAPDRSRDPAVRWLACWLYGTLLMLRLLSGRCSS